MQPNTQATTYLHNIHIPVRIDAATFRQFALFDTFVRGKRWRGPALFAALLSASACICFAMHARRGAVLLGCVLLLVGLGLPAAWLASYLLSLRAQARRMHLATPQHAYTLLVRDSGVEISSVQGKGKTTLAWGQVYAAYRRKACTYLYADAAHAYLLPHSQIEGGEAGLWAMLAAHLPAEKCFDMRR
jgi:hypothetical protein